MTRLLRVGYLNYYAVLKVIFPVPPQSGVLLLQLTELGVRC